MPLVDLPKGAQLDPPETPRRLIDLPAGASLDAGIMANIGAGANDMVASAAGAPVDAMTWFVNKLHEAATGNSQPWITAPVGGSDSIRATMGAIGADPRNIGANTPGTKLARDVGGAIPATVLPYLGARAAIERGATGILPRMLGGAGGPGQSVGQTAAGAALSGAVGAGGVLGGQMAENVAGDFAGDGAAPTANLLGQLAGGVLTGGALTGATRAGARMISPTVSPDVRLLMEAGITPTPGQILGGRTGRLEEAVTSIPWLGDVARSARIRANEQFNRGAINRALAPIGGKLDDNMPMGREAIEEMQGKISAAYNEVVPKLSATVDRGLADDVVKLRGMAGLMPAETRRQFEHLIKEEFATRLSPAGKITGESFQSLDELLGKTARNYRHSSSGSERQYGDAVYELQESLRNWLQRGNPASTEYADARRAYALGERVNVAAARPGADPGVFTPAQLQSSVRQMDPTMLKHAFSRGDALMQDYADAGRTVLGNRLPDSGTPYRTLTALLAGTGGGMAIEPTTAATAGLAGLGMAGFYTPRGQAAIAKLLTQRPDGAANIADLLRGVAPPAGAAMSSPIFGAFAP